MDGHRTDQAKPCSRASEHALMTFASVREFSKKRSKICAHSFLYVRLGTNDALMIAFLCGGRSASDYFCSFLNSSLNNNIIHLIHCCSSNIIIKQLLHHELVSQTTTRRLCDSCSRYSAATLFFFHSFRRLVRWWCHSNDIFLFECQGLGNGGCMLYRDTTTE